MEQEILGQDAKTRSGTGQQADAALPSSRLAKTHEDYWKARLRRRSYRKPDGAIVEVPEWQVKLFRDGRQRWVNLETANRDAAAKKARDHWMALKTIGWDAVKPKKERIVDPTVGDFLAAVRTEADLRPGTFEIYAKKFRRLVAGVVGVDGGKAKHDYAGTGYDEWLKRVNGVKLSRLTPEAVQRWKTRYITAAGTNPLKDRRARRTVASVLRSSKALFAGGIVRKLHMEMPNPLPLEGIEVPRIAAAQYASKIEPAVLFQQAQRELENPSTQVLAAAVEAGPVRRSKKTRRKRTASQQTKDKRRVVALDRERRQRAEMFKIMCLALFAGLRRDEIDTLAWRQIDFANHVIRVETTEHTHAKSEGSEAGVDIDPTLTALLQDWMKASKSEFVIASRVKPRPTVSTYHHYRCDCLFKSLSAWLKAHGVEDRNALHSLRKEFGTQINRTHGLFAASAALRHSSIQLTRAVYVAKKDRAVFALPGAVQKAEKGVAS